MGIWDRKYMRDASAGQWNPVHWGPVKNIIALCVVLFFGQLAAADLTRHLQLSMSQLQLGHVWTLLTYGFIHDPGNIAHVALNMFVLYTFGLAVEQLIGARRFWVFYLVALVVAGLAHCAVSLAMGSPYTAVLGASGAITAIAAFYGLEYPRRTLLLFFVIPMPALALVGIMFLVDVLGLFGFSPSSSIGHGAHIGGTLLGVAYWFLVRKLRWGGRTRRRRRRGYTEYQHAERATARAGGMDEVELDRILSKISREGMDKLGMSEREFLEKASRRYRAGDER